MSAFAGFKFSSITDYSRVSENVHHPDQKPLSTFFQENSWHEYQYPSGNKTRNYTFIGPFRKEDQKMPYNAYPSNWFN
jgi:hypothetical protein